MRRHIVYCFLSVTSVGHAVNEINKVRQQIHVFLEGRLSELSELVVRAFPYIIAARLVNFWLRSPLGRQNTEGC